MPVINRPLVGTDNDDEHHKALIGRQNRNGKGKDTSKSFASVSIGSTLAVERKKGNGGPMEQLIQRAITIITTDHIKSASPKQEK